DPSVVNASGGSATTITVTLLDAQSNPIPGVGVTLSASGTSNTLSLPPITDANGMTTATLSSTKAETKTVTAKVGTLALAQAPTVTFVASDIDETRSSVAVSPASGLTADGVATSTITVTVRDVNNNPVSGVGVTFAASGGGNAL